MAPNHKTWNIYLLLYTKTAHSSQKYSPNRNSYSFLNNVWFNLNLPTQSEVPSTESLGNEPLYSMKYIINEFRLVERLLKRDCNIYSVSLSDILKQDGNIIIDFSPAFYLSVSDCDEAGCMGDFRLKHCPLDELLYPQKFSSQRDKYKHNRKLAKLLKFIKSKLIHISLAPIVKLL